MPSRSSDHDLKLFIEDSRIITKLELLPILKQKVSSSILSRQIKSGEFPAPTVKKGNAHCWLFKDITKLIELKKLPS